MKKVIRYFITFWTPGSFVAESWVQYVDSPDLSNVKWPKNAYALTLHQREDVVDGEMIYQGKADQIGGWFYHPDSVIESLAEVRKNPRATATLISNMECNKWDHIVWSRWRNWPQHFEMGRDIVLASP